MLGRVHAKGPRKLALEKNPPKAKNTNLASDRARVHTCGLATCRQIAPADLGFLYLKLLVSHPATKLNMELVGGGQSLPHPHPVAPKALTRRSLQPSPKNHFGQHMVHLRLCFNSSSLSSFFSRISSMPWWQQRNDQ